MQESDTRLKNIFIRYLEIAVTRTRKSYIKKMKSGKEELIAPEILAEVFTDKPSETYELPETLTDSWDPAKIRIWMKAELEEPLWNAVKGLTDFEIIILYAKVFQQLTFVEISQILEIDWQKVASAYTYTRKKIKKELKNSGV